MSGKALHRLEVYLTVGPMIRRFSNQFLFEKLLIDEQAEVEGALYREPWSTMLAEGFIEACRRTTNPDPSEGRGLKERDLVPGVGFEPTRPLRARGV